MKERKAGNVWKRGKELKEDGGSHFRCGENQQLKKRNREREREKRNCRFISGRCSIQFFKQPVDLLHTIPPTATLFRLPLILSSSAHIAAMDLECRNLLGHQIGHSLDVRDQYLYPASVAKERSSEKRPPVALRPPLGTLTNTAVTK